MSISVEQVNVVSVESKFYDEIVFDVEIECFERISTYTKWEVVYASTTTVQDQILTTVYVGPIEIGVNRFVIKSPPPDISKFSDFNDYCFSLVMLKAYYDEQEFIRISYYATHTYTEGQTSISDINLNEAERKIEVDRALVKKSKIKW